MRCELKAAACALLMLAAPGATVAQAGEESEMTESAAARALLDSQVTPERDRALSLALELGSRAGPVLRKAVIEAAWAEVRGEIDRTDEDESVFSYMDAVAGLRDPRAIPFLLHVLPSGNGASNALADLGRVAFPAVLETVANPVEHPHRVKGGVTTLRFMLEDGSLGARDAALVREVVHDRLSEQQDDWVVRNAMHLAFELGDPELRRIVERLATDRAAAEALVSPYWPDGERMRTTYLKNRLDGVQERAGLLLAGRASEIGPFRKPWPHSSNAGSDLSVSVKREPSLWSLVILSVAARGGQDDGFQPLHTDESVAATRRESR